MTRNLILSLVLVQAIGAMAQQAIVATPREGSSWQHVQALPVGASISVKARKSHANCKLKSVDEDTLTCTHGKDVVFERTDIVNIKIPRRGRSTLIATAIGAGVGAGVGAAVGHTSCNQQQQQSFLGCFQIVSQGQVAAIGAVAFGVVAAPIGYFSDFAKSTVYKAQ